jgi:hypothetical protein
VRVSLICFGAKEAPGKARLDGALVSRINSDLTGARLDFTAARRLRENRSVAFMGDTKGGAFDIPGDLAREWLQLPLNPNGRPNSDVLRPWMNGMDLTRQPSGRWIIDFGWEMSEQEAALYEAPTPTSLSMSGRCGSRTAGRHTRPIGGATLNRGPVCGVLWRGGADILRRRQLPSTGYSAGATEPCARTIN